MSRTSSLIVGLFLVGCGGATGDLNRTSITCPTGRTLLDGVCVNEAIADYVACVRAQGAHLGGEKAQRISAEAGTIGVRAGGSAEVVESLEKKYAASDQAILAIIQTCNATARGPAGAPGPTAAAAAAPAACTGGSCPPIRFEATGAEQRWTVPPGVSRVAVKAWGAGGAICGQDAGGGGGYSEGTLEVRPGEVLSIIVGETGGKPSNGRGGRGGCGGGGDGGDAVFNWADNGGCGGGGRSQVTANNGKIIAGGGGSPGWGGATGTVGAGGGTVGGAGSQVAACYAGNQAGSGGGAGAGATQVEPGAGGVGCADGLKDQGNGMRGGPLSGGKGGSDTSGSRGRGGGGGGGGLFGGGGGGASDMWSAGVGAGGSGSTVPGGLTSAGSASSPANAPDPERGVAGSADHAGLVLLRPM